MKIIDGGVTAAEGFQAAGLAAGIKKGNTKDMALVYSEKPCVAAGTFTTNVVKAAPVKWDQHIVYDAPTAQAIVCNSGVANACTGEEGYGYCKETAKIAAESLQIPEDSVLVASTGVIGKQLPMDLLGAGIKNLVPLLSHTREAEKLAFLTEIEGVYLDPNDPSTLLSKLFVKEAKELIDNGNVGGGMIPKLQNCIDAIEEGVSRVHILDGRIPHCLLLEIFTNKGIGTAILRKDEIKDYDVQ